MQKHKHYYRSQYRLRRRFGGFIGGVYYTPRGIVRFIHTECGDVREYDGAIGTGGFLSVISNEKV